MASLRLIWWETEGCERRETLRSTMNVDRTGVPTQQGVHDHPDRGRCDSHFPLLPALLNLQRSHWMPSLRMRGRLRKLSQERGVACAQQSFVLLVSEFVFPFKANALSTARLRHNLRRIWLNNRGTPNCCGSFRVDSLSTITCETFNAGNGMLFNGSGCRQSRLVELRAGDVPRGGDA